MHRPMRISHTKGGQENNDVQIRSKLTESDALSD